jgi:hypothetical protein
MTNGILSWTLQTPPADAAFIALATRWAGNVENDLLEWIWAGFERLRGSSPVFDGRDLERSITQLLTAAIDDVVPGEAPYYVQHSPFERETMLPAPAQPPAYDLAFVLRADPRVMWPAEAKILNSPRALADYLADIRDQFLTCRYAPFVASGTMLGYLLDGSEQETLTNIAARLGIAFEDVASGSLARSHRSSVHDRTVPTGKSYPTPFRCHHIIFGFHGLERERPQLPS